MEEPLKYLYGQYGFQKEEIKEVVIGEKYLAVVLINGDMGVCAILKNEIKDGLLGLGDKRPDYSGTWDKRPRLSGNFTNKGDKSLPISIENGGLNLDSPSHRVFYTAWLNAKLNYRNDYTDQKDIFDLIKFPEYKRIVMIGYFKPVAEKLRKAKIDFSVFDLYKQDKEIVPLEMQREYVRGADAIILTATSIFNNTFRNIVCNTSPGACDIFVLGPSAILSKELFKYRNVKNVFGFVFPKGGEQALQIIREGGGTRSFNKFGSKVYI